MKKVIIIVVLLLIPLIYFFLKPNEEMSIVEENNEYIPVKKTQSIETTKSEVESDNNAEEDDDSNDDSNEETAAENSTTEEGEAYVTATSKADPLPTPSDRELTKHEKFLEKLESKPEKTKNYMYGILPGVEPAPEGMDYNTYNNSRNAHIVKCSEGDGGRFYFIFDIAKEMTILFDYKRKAYIFSYKGMDVKIVGDDLVYTSKHFREELDVTYNFKATISKSNEVGEGELYYKYENANKDKKDKTWPFTCEITK